MRSWWEVMIWVAPALRRSPAGVREAIPITRMLAFAAAVTPETESSTTIQSFGE